MNQQYRINAAWKQLARSIVMTDTCVLVVGPSDAGKSTFCRFLIDIAYKESLKVALIDSDIGQSQIGPPTTIGMKLFDPLADGDKQLLPFSGDGNELVSNCIHTNSENDNKNYADESYHQADSLYFVGNITPRYNLLPLLTGTRVSLDTALEKGANFTVIDTTGFIHGEAATMLKQQKIEIIRPHHLVCIGLRKEFENIVGCYIDHKWLSIHHLLPHKLASIKNSETRKQNRIANFKAYFDRSEVQQIPFENIRSARTNFFNGRIANSQELENLTNFIEKKVIYAEWGNRSLNLITERKLPDFVCQKLKNYLSLIFIVNETPAYFEQLLVGMIDDEGATVAIGIIENIDFINHKLNIRCASDTVQKIKALQFGDYRLNSDTFEGKSYR